jgi:DNA-binding NtrC family response regulator
MNTSRAARILCVEDDRTIRENTSEALRDAGFEVLEAEDGHAAMNILTDPSVVDILFTDVKMPGSLDGVDLVNSVRAEHPAIPVVITSGYASGLSERLRALIPPTVFISKPYCLNEVVDILKALTANDS